MFTKGALNLAMAGVAIVGILVVSGCSKNKSTNPNNTPPPTHSSHFHSVAISGFTFSPAAVAIAVGDTVEWTNSDNASHTVTSDVGSELNSGSIGHGQTFMHIFMAIGAHPYHCSIHTNMHGAVAVS